MDEQLKGLMMELGNAINDSLSDSDKIAEAVGKIKRAGYNVFLVLEATIGFNKREPGEDDEEEGAPKQATATPAKESPSQIHAKYFDRDGEPVFNDEDVKALKKIKVRVKDDPPSSA